MGLLHFLISLLSTTIGAISGIAGGVIIKPCLDTVGNYDVATIGMLSSITVLSMTAVSTVRFMQSRMKFELRRAIILSIGAGIGGVLGKYLFGVFSQSMSDHRAKGIQAVLLILLLVFVLLRNYFPHGHSQNIWKILFCGLIMGGISSFLGIGGGPINVAIICIAFSIPVKDAAVYSLFSIFFSQLTTVGSSAISPGLDHYDLTMLSFMIPGAMIGALLGAFLNRRLTDKVIDTLFNTVMYLLIVLNTFNIYRFLIKG